MFGRDAHWWFGENSLFAEAIKHTKWGAGAVLPYGGGYPAPSSTEANFLKYGAMFGLFYLLAKK
mgnify:CR=1 FL=1